jgi:hypothetical protein
MAILDKIVNKILSVQYTDFPVREIYILNCLLERGGQFNFEISQQSIQILIERLTEGSILDSYYPFRETECENHELALATILIFVSMASVNKISKIHLELLTLKLIFIFSESRTNSKIIELWPYFLKIAMQLFIKFKDELSNSAISNIEAVVNDQKIRNKFKNFEEKRKLPEFRIDINLKFNDFINSLICNNFNFIRSQYFIVYE